MNIVVYQMEIFINNSLNKNKDVLQIQEKQLTWYMCGPTVYNDSHLGHARTYLTFDIIRRILSDYFGQELFVVMNITDIDDKIIKRTIQEHLYEKFNSLPDNIKELTYEKIKQLIKLKKLNSGDKKEIMYDYLYNNADLNNINLKNEDFISFARKHEESFFKDMDALNIKRPNVVTRVTEYVPEIVQYIEKIIQNNYAYVLNGSVYFDTIAFKLDNPEYYNPFKINMSNNDFKNKKQFNKKHPHDFALWKKAKPGEPFWDSPWSKGRPGWHIECSCMATAILGKTMDIHSGGIDLLFPHHNNEILQCNAHYLSNQHNNDIDKYDWTKYFLHSGHLNINGLKMSKSLKNFITIKEGLQINSARQIRIMYLFHDWDKSMDYCMSSLEHAQVFEKTCVEFFSFVNYKIKKAKDFIKWDNIDQDFQMKINKIKSDIHKHLSNNFGTRKSMILLQQLITDTYTYTKKSDNLQKSLLVSVMDYLSKLMHVFGLVEKGTLGFSDCEQMNLEKTISPYVDTLVEFRDLVRQHIFTIPNKKKLNKINDINELKNMILQTKNNVLNECDIVRDKKLSNLNVQIEDKGKDKNSIWKLYNE